MATNTEYYRNLLAFHVAQGNADESNHGDDEFSSFSDCYKSDFGFRPRGEYWTRRRICEYFISRPEYGYADDGTPLHTAQEAQECAARERARLDELEAEHIEEGRQRLLQIQETEELEAIPEFDYDSVFRSRRRLERRRAARAELLRAFY